MNLAEHKDYYLLPNGLLVFTASYLTARGYCCGNGCLHCPHEYVNVLEPKRSELIKKQMKTAPRNKESIYDAIYDIVRCVPKGRVTSYGAVAAAIGAASGARW
jgi:hypothetical protein